MFRFALSVFLILIVAGITMTPDVDPVRLAAAQVGSLLNEPAQYLELEDRRRSPEFEEADSAAGSAVEGAQLPPPRPEPSDSRVEGRALWRAILDSSAAHELNDGTIELWVRGYRIDLKHTGYQDVRLHARSFESIVRTLHSIAAEEGFEFTIRERNKPDFPGLVFYVEPGDETLSLFVTLPEDEQLCATQPWSPPSSDSLLPSVIAIAIAVLLRRPLLALLCGALSGVYLATGGAASGVPHGEGIAARLAATVALAWAQLAELARNPERQAIFVFLVAMLAMIGIAQRAGGLRGLVELVARRATNARRSQAAAYTMGLVVFFDHYANTVLVGSAMRGLSDRFRVAREKLAYIVDSTAAPVAGLSLFSTWIAFEVSAFAPHLPDAGLAASQGYEIFLRSLPYRAYSLLTLFFVGLVIASGRDFGPMLRAERRARRGQVLRDGARLLTRRAGGQGLFDSSDSGGGAGGPDPHARALLRPLGVFVAVTLASTLVRGGLGEAGLSLAGLGGALLRGSGAVPLLIGSLAGLVVALFEGLSAGLGRDTWTAAWRGVNAVRAVLVLLLLAWMLGSVCARLGTASYLAVLLQEGPNPLLLPVILFLLAALVAFATGSSWSTMTILLPIVVGLAYEAGPNTPIGVAGLLLVSIGAVLEGAIFGDHCSPIADSTVMSSIAAGSDHVDHVRTQAPYALLVMIVALAVCYFPVVFLGTSPWVCLGAGALALAVFLRIYGSRVDAPGKDSGRAAEPVEEETEPQAPLAA